MPELLIPLDSSNRYVTCDVCAGTEDMYYRQMDLIKKLMEELKKCNPDGSGNTSIAHFPLVRGICFFVKSANCL